MKTLKSGYKSEELENALYKIEDLADRLQIPIFLLGKTAEDVNKGEKLEDADGVYVGIKSTAFTPFNTSMLLTLQPDIKKTDYGYYFEHESVPIHIKVVKKNYSFLDKLQLKFYKVTEYWLPNPMENYLKARNLIQ